MGFVPCAVAVIAITLGAWSIEKKHKRYRKYRDQ